MSYIPKTSVWNRSGGLGSLWDVINATLTGLAPLIYQLALYEALTLRGDGEGREPIGPDITHQVEGWLRIAGGIANNFEIAAAINRIEIMTAALARGMTWDDLATESRVLRQALEYDFKHQLIYRYYQEQATVLMRWQDEWKPTLDKFPSTLEDVRGAVDCWALGHSTASVYHSMRILEYGLAALANELGKEAGVKNWQNVIDEIESEIRHQGKALHPGVDKMDRLGFLSEAAKEFVYFKDGWRNFAAHGRATYDAHQARSVLEHVRSFMNALSGRLSEVPLGKRPS
jgi:hypothetical protein